ncbi:hypothetical protein JD969_09710 [Planctomycetota bacterium]|nr:hypothetical protein JD969_09710 [Planctomycetota bacterium]
MHMKTFITASLSLLIFILLLAGAVTTYYVLNPQKGFNLIIWFAGTGPQKQSSKKTQAIIHPTNNFLPQTYYRRLRRIEGLQLPDKIHYTELRRSGGSKQTDMNLTLIIPPEKLENWIATAPFFQNKTFITHYDMFEEPYTQTPSHKATHFRYLSYTSPPINQFEILIEDFSDKPTTVRIYYDYNH